MRVPVPPSLNALQKWVAEQGEPEAVMEDLGLLLHDDLAHGGYWCTPTNSLAFASTGGDGVHYSFVDLGDGATDSSPIVMTVPMSSDPNWIVGANLLDFLSLGLGSGYFSIEQLSYGADLLAIAEGPVDATASRVLADLGGRLGLHPWVDADEHLHLLDEQFGDLLIVQDIREQPEA